MRSYESIGALGSTGKGRRMSARDGLQELAVRAAHWLDTEFYDGTPHEQAFSGGKVAVWSIFRGNAGWDRAVIELTLDDQTDRSHEESIEPERLMARVNGDKLLEIEGSGAGGKFIPYGEMSPHGIDYDTLLLGRFLEAVQPD